MSINEIIKKNLPINNQKFSKLTTKVNHCQAKFYQYCAECRENKLKFCNEKLDFYQVKQMNTIRWHLYFKCQKNHLIIRWVVVDNKDIIVGILKN